MERDAYNSVPEGGLNRLLLVSSDNEPNNYISDWTDDNMYSPG